MRAIARYRTHQKSSAPPQQVVLMLLQTAVHRLGQAARDEAQPGSASWVQDLHHVREIFLELAAALDHEAAPELCGKLHPLYMWSVRQLARAGRERSKQRVVEVLRVATSLLEGWQVAVYG